MKALVETRDYVQEFADALGFGLESIVKAAGIYVEAVDANPENAISFHEAFRDTIPASAWTSFEAVGRKWMHPKLLLGGGGRYSNKIKKLPYSVQKQVFDGQRFQLLTKDGGKLNVDIREVTPEQAEQLLDGQHIRNLAEQKAYLESMKTMGGEDPEPMPYTIRNGKVCFRRGATLTRQEIKRLLADM